MPRTAGLFLILGAIALTSSIVPSAHAGEVVSEKSSSSSSNEIVVEKKGNAFKYGERLKNWAAQVDLGLAKGWLTADEGAAFKTRLDSLRQLHDTVSAKGYAKPDLDDMEKQFNVFNIDLSTACSKPKATAGGAKEASGDKAKAPVKAEKVKATPAKKGK